MVSSNTYIMSNKHDDTLPVPSARQKTPPKPVTPGSGRQVTELRGSMMTPEPLITSTKVPSTNPEEAANLVGGRYRLEEMLGEGGMGQVYRAIDTVINKTVALKCMTAGLPEEEKKRFEQEAHSMAKIKHENVVDVTDYGRLENDLPFFVMELLKGEDLFKMIEREGALPLERVIRITAQVCRGLGAAHQEGIVHRDVKPQNILLVKWSGKEDFVKIIDFGIAKVLGGKGVTVAGLIGTPFYMSPEQATGDPVDNRTDIYSIGIMMYEMLTGKVPFIGENNQKTLHLHLYVQPMAPSEARPDLRFPPEVDQVILKAIEKDRNKRFQSAGELEAAVMAIPLTWTDAPEASQEDRIAPLEGAHAPVTERNEGIPVVAAHSKKGVVAAIVGGTVAAIAMGLLVGNMTRQPKPQKAQTVLVLQDASARAPTSSPAPDATVEEENKKTCRIRIVTEPAGADVLVFNDKIGVTPFEADFTKENRKIEFTINKPGFGVEKIDAMPDGDKEFNRKLVKELAESKKIKKPGRRDKGKKDLDKVIKIPEHLK